ncbi:MAG: ATP-binding protein [Phormidesmis sp.]
MASTYLSGSFQSPRRKNAFGVMLKMALAVFVAEAVVMVLLMGLPPIPDLVEVFADATILSVLIAPALYLFVYKPLYEEIFQRAQIDIELRKSQETLQKKAAELEETVAKLQQMPQLIQAEKMSSLEGLVAGIAHEINNPATFIYGNLVHVEEYMQDLLDIVKLYQEHCSNPSAEIKKVTKSVDLNFLQKDLSSMLTSIRSGTERVSQIVSALRDFSRLDESDLKTADVHSGLESTLLLLQHRLIATPVRSEIELFKDYGQLPQIECFPRQLNQVFLNILTNAVDAIELASERRQYAQQKRLYGRITIRTAAVDTQWIKIVIKDNGAGIPAQTQGKIFDPFFTTKPIGCGTGMGLSISYQIVVGQHDGKLDCHSTEGEGTEFVIQLPLNQKI